MTEFLPHDIVTLPVRVTVALQVALLPLLDHVTFLVDAMHEEQLKTFFESPTKASLASLAGVRPKNFRRTTSGCGLPYF